MAKIRQVIRHVSVEFAKGDRRCRRNKSHTISAGSPCLAIQEPGGPFKKCYCAECALPILRQCASDLRGIRNDLYGPDFDGRKPAQETAVGRQLVKNNRERTNPAPKRRFTIDNYETNNSQNQSSTREENAA